jgi:hypothetical protein
VGIELSSAECLRFAEECRALAKLAGTIEEKMYLWEREAGWTKLAEQAERKRAPGVGKPGEQTSA